MVEAIVILVLKVFASLEIILAELLAITEGGGRICPTSSARLTTIQSLMQFGCIRSQTSAQHALSPICRNMTTAVISTSEYTVSPAAYPATTKTAHVSIKGLSTTATVVNFADKIFITVTQDGRLAHWVNILPQIYIALSNFFRSTSPSTYPQQTPQYPRIPTSSATTTTLIPTCCLCTISLRRLY